MKTDQLSLKHEYNDHEMASLSREISRSLSDKLTLEKELEGVRADYKARITGQDALIASLSARISCGFEMQSQKCVLLDERQDGSGLNGYRLIVRADTGHVIRRRKLEPHERQTELPLEVSPECVAIATLPNDDESWPVPSVQVPLYQDEYEALGELPDVAIAPPPKAAKASKR